MRIAASHYRTMTITMVTKTMVCETRDSSGNKQGDNEHSILSSLTFSFFSFVFTKITFSINNYLSSYSV